MIVTLGCVYARVHRDDMNVETPKSVDATMIFRECDIRNKQRSFHNKGVEITDRGDVYT